MKFPNTLSLLPSAVRKVMIEYIVEKLATSGFNIYGSPKYSLTDLMQESRDAVECF